MLVQSDTRICGPSLLPLLVTVKFYCYTTFLYSSVHVNSRCTMWTLFRVTNLIWKYFRDIYTSAISIPHYNFNIFYHISNDHLINHKGFLSDLPVAIQWLVWRWSVISQESSTHHNNWSRLRCHTCCTNNAWADWDSVRFRRTGAARTTSYSPPLIIGNKFYQVRWHEARYPVGISMYHIFR